MKLLRFEVAGSDAPRAGIFHEGKVLETDGERAIGVFEPAQVRLLPPVTRPPALRVFDSFGARGARPLFEFRDSAALAGTEAEIFFPRDSKLWDFECQIGAVISSEEEDIAADEAEAYILGYTLLCVWAARDDNRKGTAKEHDFCASVGPFIVTPEEVGAVQDIKFAALVNGRKIASGNTSAMSYTFSEMLAEASRGAAVRPGDIIATGPAFTLESLGQKFLQPGDQVTIATDALGTLVGKVAK